MGYLTPPEILQVAADKGTEKANAGVAKLLALSFLGGMYIACGYLACLRISSSFPAGWGGVGAFLGACVFPIGLIAILLGGGELITGNMMVVTVALARRRIRPGQLVYNWGLVTAGNIAGAVATAMLFGHVVGLTEGGVLGLTVSTALAKTNASFVSAFVSGIGCNIFVCLAVWLSFGAKSFTGKVIGIWFPVMTFVAIGFQHVVANMFVIPAAIFAGATELTWSMYVQNFIPVYLGNAAGGAFLGLCYSFIYGKTATKKMAKT